MGYLSYQHTCWTGERVGISWVQCLGCSFLSRSPKWPKLYPSASCPNPFSPMELLGGDKNRVSSEMCLAASCKYLASAWAPWCIASWESLFVPVPTRSREQRTHPFWATWLFAFLLHFVISNLSGAQSAMPSTKHFPPLRPAARTHLIGAYSTTASPLHNLEE